MKKAAVCKFRGRSKDCESSIEGYLWLVEKMMTYKPSAIESFDKLRPKHFAQHRDGLPPSAKPVAVGRWYANANISNADKFNSLGVLSAFCDLSFGTDWDYVPEMNTEATKKERQLIIDSERALREFLAK